MINIYNNKCVKVKSRCIGDLNNNLYKDNIEVIRLYKRK